MNAFPLSHRLRPRRPPSSLWEQRLHFSALTERPCVPVSHTRQRARAQARSRVYGRAADGGDLLFIFPILLFFLFFFRVCSITLPFSTRTIARLVFGARARTIKHEKGNKKAQRNNDGQWTVVAQCLAHGRPRRTSWTALVVRADDGR